MLTPDNSAPPPPLFPGFSPKVKCDKLVPDQCTTTLHIGDPAPFAGVLMSTPLAIQYKTTLDAATAKLEEEKRYCSEQARISAAASTEAQKILKDSAAQREALLQKALDKEQERSRQEARETSQAESAQILWAAGGVAIGLVVGVVAGGAAVVYLSCHAP